MKNKGFTLAEILGVIVVIGLLLLLVIPALVNRINSRKKQTSSAVKEIIYNAAGEYIEENNREYKTGKKYCINISTLIEENKLVNPLIDPTSNEDYSSELILATISDNRTIDYQIIKDTETCEYYQKLPFIQIMVDNESWATEKTVKIKYPEVGTEEYPKPGSAYKYELRLDGSTEGPIDVSNDLDSDNSITITVRNNNTKVVASMYYGETLITANKTVKRISDEISDFHNISYILNGGTLGSNAPTRGEYNKTTRISNPSKTVTIIGHENGTDATITSGSDTSKDQTFAGWTGSGLGSEATTGMATNPATSWDGSLTTNEYFKNLRTAAGIVTMTANWTPVAMKLPTAEKQGYTCSWYKEASLENKVGSSGADYTPNKNSTSTIDVYAKCNTNTYTVRYISNNNNCTLNSATYANKTATYGTAWNVVNPSCNGYTFTGWTASTLSTSTAQYGSSGANTSWNNGSTPVKGTNSTYFNNLTTSDAGTVTLTANWTAVDYTVTVVAGTGINTLAATGWTNTGTSTLTKTYHIGDTIDLSAMTPTYKTGYSGTSYTKSSGQGSISNSTFTVGAGAATITIKATTLATPTCTMQGGTTKVYNRSATTLTATSMSTSYDMSSVNITYSFGYASSASNTLGNFSAAQSGNTISIGKDAYRGTRYYGVTVVVTDKTDSSITATCTSGTGTNTGTNVANRTTMTLVNSRINFDATTNGGTLVGDSPVYVSYEGTAATTYSGRTNTTARSIPTATKEGYTFTGWWTESSGGTKVINADGTLTSTDISGWTNSSNQWVKTGTSDSATAIANMLYAQFRVNTCTVQYNLYSNNATVLTTNKGYNKNSSNYVTYTPSGGTAATDFHQVNYNDTVNLYDINNQNALYAWLDYYSVDEGSEWAIYDGSNVEYLSQSTDYKATDICQNLASGDETVTVYAGWRINRVNIYYNIAYKYNNAWQLADHFGTGSSYSGPTLYANSNSYGYIYYDATGNEDYEYLIQQVNHGSSLGSNGLYDYYNTTDGFYMYTDYQGGCSSATGSPTGQSNKYCRGKPNAQWAAFITDSLAGTYYDSYSNEGWYQLNQATNYTADGLCPNIKYGDCNAVLVVNWACTYYDCASYQYDTIRSCTNNNYTGTKCTKYTNTYSYSRGTCYSDQSHCVQSYCSSTGGTLVSCGTNCYTCAYVSGRTCASTTSYTYTNGQTCTYNYTGTSSCTSWTCKLDTIYNW